MVFSLIIPCFNEENNVEAMHNRIEEAFRDCDYDYEMIFVNDGSSDKTAEKIRHICDVSHQNITFLDFSRNFGKEAAMFAGLENCKGDYAVIIDGDLQQPPEFARKMLEFLIENPDYDCVAAYQESRIESHLNSFLKKSFYTIINKMTYVKFVHDASDFRVLKRNMIDAVISLKESSRFSKGIFSWVGFNTKFVPYTPEERHSGETKWSLIKLFKYACNGIISFSVLPLKVPAFLSVISLLASALFIILKAVFGTVTEVSALIFVVLFMSGVLLGAVSLVSLYLSRIYSESKDRPIYVLRDKIEANKK